MSDHVTVTSAALAEKLAALRTRFLENSLGRIAELRSAIDALRVDSADRAALERLSHHFHGLAGAAGTYGLPELSALGRSGEEACLGAKRENVPLTAAELATCDTLVEAIALAVENASSAPPKAIEQIPVSSVLDVYTAAIISADAEFAGRLARSLDRNEIVTMIISPDSVKVPQSNLAIIDLDSEHAIGRIRGRAAGTTVFAVATSLDILNRADAVRKGADACFLKVDEWNVLLERVRQERMRATAPPARILSVEDDPDQAQFIRTVLESSGYEVRICGAAAEVETDLRAYEPDLMVMDVNLGGAITGHHLARSIRQQALYATLPIVFLTARDEIQTVAESRFSGGDDHLVKPVTPNLLLTVVAARLERSRMLRHLLDHDSLTGLLTHTAFYGRASASFHRARAEDGRAVVAMVDVDHFKNVNDSYGHVMGDRVLAELAALLRQRIRASDAAGRYGGEEFGIILNGIDLENAQRIINRIRQEWANQEHRTPSGQSFRVTFSAGLASCSSSLPDVTSWINAADGALYEAKRAGRNRVHTFPALESAATSVMPS